MEPISFVIVRFDRYHDRANTFGWEWHVAIAVVLQVNTYRFTCDCVDQKGSDGEVKSKETSTWTQKRGPTVISGVETSQCFHPDVSSSSRRSFNSITKTSCDRAILEAQKERMVRACCFSCVAPAGGLLVCMTKKPKNWYDVHISFILPYLWVREVVREVHRGLTQSNFYVISLQSSPFHTSARATSTCRFLGLV